MNSRVDGKERQASAPGSDTGSAVSLRLLRPALIAALAGLVASAVLLWFGLLAPWHNEYRNDLARSQAAALASGLSQAVHAVDAESLAVARNPLLAQALTSNDPQQVRRTLDGLRYLDGLIDIRLYGVQQATLDTQADPPINFSVLDLIKRTEAGQPLPIEAYKAGDRWLAYRAVPVRAAPQEPVQGTLLMVYDLRRLTQSLALPTPDAGQAALLQKLFDSPETSLYQFGNGDSTHTFRYSTGNPHWAVAFVPGPAYQFNFPASTVALMLLAAALALAGAIAGTWLSNRTLQERLDSDVRQLSQLLHELSNGKPVKAFGLSLPGLNDLARSLARLSQLRPREAEKPKEPAESTPALDARDDPLVDPLFQSASILDTDVIDDTQESPRLEPRMNSPAHLAPQLPESIFRAYDIRGVVGDTLTAEYAYWIGRAIGAQSLAQGEPNVAVGRDGRLSGPELVKQLIQGIADAGCHVSDVGLVPTPALYYAANVLKGKSGVMLTGSHNPPNYNGFKIVIAGDTLANEQIQALLQRIRTNDLPTGQGSVEQVEILDRYFKEITGDIALARRLKVVVDCGNGAAGVIAPKLIEALNCEVISLFEEVDGNFPNHHPDPGHLENLQDLIAKVKETGADLGLAFDGDGDRVGVVTENGNVVFPDRLLMLFAEDVLERNPGADIIFDVKCSRNLTPLIKQHNGVPMMYKTGHSLIKKQMKKTGALLAGEMSGHIFFKERWFGFDDGIYSAVRLLEILSKRKETAEAIFEQYPNDVSTPEINIKVTDEGKFSIIDALQTKAQWGQAQLNTIDGVRVDYPKGWGLVRASNTTPVLVLRFEAETEAELSRIQKVFHDQLKAVAPDLAIPF